jgi:thioesterase domain-containing protein
MMTHPQALESGATNVAAFLAELRRLDIAIGADGDRLQCHAPAGVLTGALRDQIRHRKGEIVEFLRAADALSQRQKAIVPLQTRGHRDAVFAIGGHNGDVFCYRALAQHLGAQQPFFGLQPPGLDEASAPLARVEDLAAYFSAQIRAFRSNGRCVIAGYCAGGTIAFETARQLREQGGVVEDVVLFAGPFPSWYRFLPQLCNTVVSQVARLRKHAGALARSDRAPYIADAFGRWKQRRHDTRATATDPLLARRTKVGQVTLEAVRRYKPQRFDGRLCLILPNRNWQRSYDALLARQWRPFARDVEEHCGPDDCSGDRILLEPYVRTTAELFHRARHSVAG